MMGVKQPKQRVKEEASIINYKIQYTRVALCGSGYPKLYTLLNPAYNSNAQTWQRQKGPSYTQE